MLGSLERVDCSGFAKSSLDGFLLLVELLDNGVLYYFILIGQCPDVSSGELDLFDALRQFLDILPLRIFLISNL